MRVLVTGAAGFVGRHLVRRLSKVLGPSDVILGIGREQAPRLSCAYEPVDLCDRAEIFRVIASFRPTHLVHLAARSSVTQAAAAAIETWRTNFGMCLNLAEAVVEWAPDATFVFVSSGEVYGRAFLSGRPVDETVTPEPANVYARTKLAGEQIFIDAFGRTGVKLAIMRPFNHIGPGQDERFVVPSLAGQIARIEAGLVPPILRVGDLSARRDFLPVDDVVDAYCQMLTGQHPRADLSILNVCSAQPQPISDILDRLGQLSKAVFKVEVDPGRLRPSEIPIASGNWSALHRLTGWSPATSLDDCLAAVIADARRRLADREAWQTPMNPVQ